MAEEFMKLIGTEIQGPTSLKLMFSINMSGKSIGTNCETKEFDVRNVVRICFSLTRVNSCYDTEYKMSVKHITIVTDFKIKTQVICEKFGFNINLLCTDQWTDWKHMGTSRCNEYLGIQITIIVSKEDSMIRKLYEDEEFTDFKLSASDGTVLVHKAHLAANSDVFRAMLSREWKETTEGRVQIEGVTRQTLEDLKRYMYLGTLPHEGLCRLGPLLIIARCYLIDTLKVECLIKLAQSVTSGNLYDILEFSIMNKMPELTFYVLEAMPKSLVKDARKKIVKNNNASETAEQAEENTEQEQNNVKNEE